MYFDLIGLFDNPIPGQIDDSDEKVKKEVQFKTRAEIVAEEMEKNTSGSTNSSSTLSIPTKPSRNFICCCWPRLREGSKSGRKDNDNKEDGENIGHNNLDSAPNNDGNQNSISERSTLDFNDENEQGR